MPVTINDARIYHHTGLTKSSLYPGSGPVAPALAHLSWARAIDYTSLVPGGAAHPNKKKGQETELHRKGEGFEPPFRRIKDQRPV